MKKLSILVLALVLLVALGSVTMASTMGVAVSEGQSVTLEYYSLKDVDLGPYVDYSWSNDSLKITVGYQFEDDNVDNFALKTRYEFTENIAGVLNYSTDGDTGSTSFGIRGKYAFSDPFAVTGQLTYNSSNVANLFVQGEYTITDGLFVTAGGYFYDGEIPDSGSGINVGIEYAFDAWDLYLDYDKDADVDDGTIILGINYTL